MHIMKSRQKGLTLISFLVIFIVAGFFILLTLKIVPVYLDHMKIESSLEGLKNEKGIAFKSPQEIKQLLQKRWDVNSIEGMDPAQDVEIERKGGAMTIRVAYEVEKPVLGNMSALMKFDDSITVGDTN